jgi:penicillin-binding protein 1A
VRQEYILQRMLELNFITREQYDEAVAQPLVVKGAGREFSVHAEYVAEMVRQMMYAQYREETYTRGFNVVTTIDSADQQVAYTALRKGIMDYERRHGYRGPEGFIELPAGADDREQAIDDALLEHPDNGELIAAVVTATSPRQITVAFIDGSSATIDGDNLRFASSALSANAQPNRRIRPGAIVRVVKSDTGKWSITQLPQVEGAFDRPAGRRDPLARRRLRLQQEQVQSRHAGVAAARLVVQAVHLFGVARQGLGPATVINDGPLYFSAAETGGQPWDRRTTAAASKARCRCAPRCSARATSSRSGS